MIKTIKDKTTQDIFNGKNSRYARKVPQQLHDKAVRLLDQIDSVASVEELRQPPSNRLEKKEGNLKDYWALWINRQWRIIFKWKEENAYEVQITDYH
jgi:toxin HigB-1